MYTLSASKKTTLLTELPRIYEENFVRLMRLIPALRDVHGDTTVLLDGSDQLQLSILEQNRYTTLLTLEYCFSSDNQMLPNPEMKIRVYHDARLAEVIRYQQHSNIKASYPYPNLKMYQPLEKRQINLFFRDWLIHCTISKKTALPTASLL